MNAMKRNIAELATELVQGRITFPVFEQPIPEEIYQDPTVDKLVDLFRHQPKVGGFLGISQSDNEKYQDEIQAVIKELASA